MRVLVACEFSGVVRDAFAARGHDSWSCDLLPTEMPGQHIQGDVFKIIGEGWDLMVAHPPCQFLSTCGNRHLRQPGRLDERVKALAFFLSMYFCGIPKICVENPHGHVNTAFRKPDQTVHPWYFGESAMKRTGLWLRGLPLLNHEGKHCKKPEPSYFTPDGMPKYWTHKTKDHSAGTCYKERSRFSHAIAAAMAEQWG